MSVYMTEEEQLAAIKRWWQRYGNMITVALSLALLVSAAYKYWYWHQENEAIQASNAFEHLMVAFSNKDNKGIQAYSNQLIKDYSKTSYADAAHLTLAKLYVTKENYAQAIAQLQQVAEHSKMNAFKQIARIRIARLLAAKKSFDKALTELSQVDDPAYMPVINELKGDIYVATGQYKLAIASYKKAITEVRTQGMGNLFLEMKTNELAALTQSMKMERKQQASAPQQAA